MKHMKKITSLILLCVLLFSLGVNQKTYAATVGDNLPAPENGWIRYDNTSSFFVFGDGWEHLIDSKNNKPYSGTLTEQPGKVDFKFEGTKIRLITSSNYSYSKKVAISIDGVTEYFSPYKEITEYSPDTLIYEKANLLSGVHEVKIWTVEPSTNSLGYDYSLYAIDIFGELVNPETEIPIEPETPIEPEVPSGDRAILVVTMVTGLEKEFDLPMSDVNAFIKWYDARDTGMGPAKYGINKYSNNKGPFSKRTDYVIFNNILSFEVNEYTN